MSHLPPGRPKADTPPRWGDAKGVSGAVKRIGLFGGTFDPPHRAHVELARTARDAMRLDEVRWIPAGAPWQKTRAVTEPMHREAMVQLAIDGEPRFLLDRCELQRIGASFTLDTVRELQAMQPGCEWVLLIGHDQYVGLHTWRDWQALLGLVTLAVANRPGFSTPPDRQVQAFPHQAVPLAMLDISSTDIRHRVSRGEAITDLVPHAVARYIARHRLYGTHEKDAAAH